MSELGLNINKTNKEYKYKIKSIYKRGRVQITLEILKSE